MFGQSGCHVKWYNHYDKSSSFIFLRTYTGAGAWCCKVPHRMPTSSVKVPSSKPGSTFNSASYERHQQRQQGAQALGLLPSSWETEMDFQQHEATGVDPNPGVLIERGGLGTDTGWRRAVKTQREGCGQGQERGLEDTCPPALISSKVRTGIYVAAALTNQHTQSLKFRLVFAPIYAPFSIS